MYFFLKKGNYLKLCCRQCDPAVKENHKQSVGFGALAAEVDHAVFHAKLVLGECHVLCVFRRRKKIECFLSRKYESFLSKKIFF